MSHVRPDVGIDEDSKKKGESNLFLAAPDVSEDVADSVPQRLS